MTINDFVAQLDVPNNDDLMNAVSELRKDEHMGPVRDAGEETGPWVEW